MVPLELNQKYLQLIIGMVFQVDFIIYSMCKEKQIYVERCKLMCKISHQILIFWGKFFTVGGQEKYFLVSI